MTDTEAPKADAAASNMVPAEKLNEVQTKYDRTYAELVDVKKRVEALTSLGDPEAIKAKLSDYDNMRKSAATTNKDDLEKLIKDKEAEIHQAWKPKIEERDSKIESLTKTVRRYTILDPAKTLVSQMFTDDAQDLLITHIEGVADTDGEAVFVKGSDGKPMRSKIDPSQPMGLKEYLEGVAAAKPGLAKAKGTGGAHAGNTTTAGAGGITAEQYANMDQDQRRKLPAEVQATLAPLALKIVSKQQR